LILFQHPICSESKAYLKGNSANHPNFTKLNLNSRNIKTHSKLKLQNQRKRPKPNLVLRSNYQNTSLRKCRKVK